MRLTIRAKPRAKEDRVEKTGEREFSVCVRSAPEGGAANRAIIAALSEELGIPKSRLRIIAGAGARIKTIEIIGK